MAIRIGVLTSGGDAQGMNAAVRAIVRSAIHRDVEVYAIHEGWQGAVEGGDHIRRMSWGDVSGILNKGGTVIGTARSKAFRERDGQRIAVRNLIHHGIDRLIVIGGDGSLSGTRELRLSWPQLVAELVESGDVTQEQADNHPVLRVAGIVGSIDNDMVGTDMTVGTDSALHRITEAIDAISSTAESHQRTFIVEVMGRRCGYLALMSAIAGGADYTFLPESPPRDGWEDRMVEVLRRGRQAGRRDSILIVAEGAADRQGEPITAQRVKDVLFERAGEEARITILGHVQRGGTPSAYDRWMATACGVEAVRQVVESNPDDEPVLVGVHRDHVQAVPLLEAVEETRRIATYIKEADYDTAIAARGHGFEEMIQVYRTITEARPSVETGDRRIALMNAGALAPGMNPLARVAVRTGIDLGYHMWAIRGGVPGMRDGNFEELTWSEVEGMAHSGGADLGTRRYVAQETDLYQMARQLENHKIDALLVMGGFHAYATVAMLEAERRRYPAFNIPVAVIPASIDNNAPGWPMAIGADTALNTVVDAIDKVRMSASASKRAFIVETMGRSCGFLPLLGGLAGGAEQAYLPETGISLAQLDRDVAACVAGFENNRSFYLAITGEEASEHYTTQVLSRIFEAEGLGKYSVREAIVGHLQQGGSPSPFDRINATRLAYRGIKYLDQQLTDGTSAYAAASSRTPGLFAPLRDITDGMDWDNQRPYDQWWRTLEPVFAQLSHRPGQE